MKRKRLLRAEIELTEPVEPRIEVCMNPWNGVCENGDIALYICSDGQRLPICRECWSEIASNDMEWRYD